MERIGILDLGSNTARLMVMAYRPHHSFRLLDEVSERVRLVEGVRADGQLQGAPMRRAIETVKMFSAFCRATDVTHVVPVATSAVREATNQAAFLDEVESASGLRLRVLSGEEEAYYGYLGVVNSLSFSDGCVVDIGGGSAEVTAVRGRALWHSVSRQAGIVRFSERYVRSDPINNRDFRALEAGAEEAFRSIDWLDGAPGTTLVGLGGAARSLAHMHQKAVGYPLDRVHGYTMHQEDLDGLVEQLRGLNQREREHVPGLSRHRADVILAGAVLLRHLMHQGRFEQFLVSGQGLREGLFYQHFLAGQELPLFEQIRTFSVQNLAHRYTFEPLHVAKVRDLCIALFDQLAPLHGYGAWERELLGHAATLHDIGVTVDYYDHHKHSAYLVLNSSLGGFSHREIVLLALLTRFHRKGDSTLEPFAPMMQRDDGERLARLSALLRIAEYLERSKSQTVRGLHVAIGADEIRITAQTLGDATVEIWDANRRTGLFRKAFGRDITIVRADDG